jgi:hypothetical protein
MTQQEKIDAVALALAAARQGAEPNSLEKEFARQFVIAWNRMIVIDEVELAARITAGRQTTQP